MNAPDIALCSPRQHLPRGEEFLFLPPWVQPYAYRIVDKLFAHRVIRRGPAHRPLPYGPEIDPRYTAGGSEYDVGAFMERHRRRARDPSRPRRAGALRAWPRRA